MSKVGELGRDLVRYTIVRAIEEFTKDDPNYDDWVFTDDPDELTDKLLKEFVENGGKLKADGNRLQSLPW